MEDDVAAAAAILRSVFAGAGLGFGFVAVLFGRAVCLLAAAGFSVFGRAGSVGAR